MDDASKGEGPNLPMGPTTRSWVKKYKSVFQSFMGQSLGERLDGPTVEFKSGPRVKIKEKDQPINLIPSVWA